MAKFKLLSDELNRMAKVFQQFKEAQEIVDGLASQEQAIVEQKTVKQKLQEDIEQLKKEFLLAKENITALESEAAANAASALSALEKQREDAVNFVNALLVDAKQKAKDIEDKASIRVKNMEDREKMVEAQVQATIAVLNEKEDQLAQIESVLAKFK